MSVTVTKATAYAVVGVGDDNSIAVTKLMANVVLGFPENSATVTKVAAYVVLAPVTGAAGARKLRAQNVQM